MIYITGDTHGDFRRFESFSKKHRTSKNDVMIILGDAGLNYYGSRRDYLLKTIAEEFPLTFLCIHGNHEMRPATISSYLTKEFHGGTVWYEEKYPSILFAKDGEIYDLNGKHCLVIGGAYSVDKYYRLEHRYGWWVDEQPSDEIKMQTEKSVKSTSIDIVFSHTCPFKYEPTEMFLSGIDQSSVDNSTEHWLDSIEESIDYGAWYCGHWHTDKRIDKMHFLFKGFDILE